MSVTSQLSQQWRNEKLTHFYLQLGVLLQQVLQEVQIMWETRKFAVKVGTDSLNLMWNTAAWSIKYPETDTSMKLCHHLRLHFADRMLPFIQTKFLDGVDSNVTDRSPVDMLKIKQSGT